VSDKALLFVVGYLIGALLLGIVIGKTFRWRRTGTTKYTEED